MRREWYVYVPVHKLVLSGYMTETDAREEASRVLREWPEAAPFEVLPRTHSSIAEYARTHPAWAKREGFESVQAQTAPPHACPLCPETVAGGPEEYLGHIRTEHPGEWRRLETDPSYALKTRTSPSNPRWVTITRELTEVERKKIAEESFRENPNLDVVYISDYSGVVEKPYYRAEPPVAEAGILRCRFCGAPYAYRENLELHERGCPKRG